MSFLESYAAFKANGGVYTINNADQMIANRPDEPWHDMLQQLAHFKALGGETVPMSYAAVYDLTKMGNCFSYAMWLETSTLSHFLERNPEKTFTSLAAYNFIPLRFGQHKLSIKSDKAERLLLDTAPFKTPRIIHDVIEDCDHFEKNPQSYKNKVPVISMIRNITGDCDYHFCLPHMQYNHANKQYNIGFSVREGFNGEVIGLPHANEFYNHQEQRWLYHYELQPQLLFIDKDNLAKKIYTTTFDENAGELCTIIGPNPAINVKMGMLPPDLRRRLDTLQFTKFEHKLDPDSFTRPNLPPIMILQ